MVTTLRRIWQWLGATFWDTCIHHARVVSADGKMGSCSKCGRKYPYRPYYGKYPWGEVDMNMPADDTRRYVDKVQLTQ